MFPDKNVTARYNGNIAESDWRSVETIGVNPSTTPKRYGYVYDALNRLSAGYYQNPNNPYSKENTESLDYDVNGNITNLYRTSIVEYGNTTATLIDKLKYDYNGNQATNINDYSSNQTGYEGGGQLIRYDLNGNMTEMPDKGMDVVKYNYLNLPNFLHLNRGGVEDITINTRYRADGTKLKKENTTSITGFSGSTTSKTTVDYLDGFQYSKTESPNTGGDGDPEMFSARAMQPQTFSPEQNALTATGAKTADLQFLPTAEGFYDYQNDQYIYQYKDHLGNVRVSFARNSAGALQLKDNNDYYPFGMNHLKTGNSYFGAGSYVKYKFGGKELQETGMYDFGARMYMADVGRWAGLDPYAERYIKTSPYQYGFNNPIFFTDPDGKKIVIYYQVGNRTFSYEYNYSENRKSTGIDFLDQTVAFLDTLYETAALNLDTDGDGKKDKNYMQALIDNPRILGINEGYKSDFIPGRSYNDVTKKWEIDYNKAIGGINFNFKNGVLFNNSEFNFKNEEALKERYKTGKLEKGDQVNSPKMSLAHEMIHAGNSILENAEFFERKNPKNAFKEKDKYGFTNKEEIRTTLLSNQAAEALGEPQRTVYWGISLPTTSPMYNIEKTKKK